MNEGGLPGESLWGSHLLWTVSKDCLHVELTQMFTTMGELGCAPQCCLVDRHGLSKWGWGCSGLI